jgi:hypothetical protein
MTSMALQSFFRKSGKVASSNAEEILVYFAFAILATAGARALSDLIFSALVTLSAAVAALGFVLLYLQVERRKQVMSVSVNSLYLYAGTLACRLYTTLQYNGYLPIDRSGDWLYQAIETGSLCLTVLLIIRVKRAQSEAGVVGVDNCSAAVLFVFGALLGMLIHPSLCSNRIADSMWTTALYVETVAMVPQLYLLTKLGGEVDSLQGHYIACMFVSRLLMMRFWITCYQELKPQAATYNLPGIGVIGSQLLQVAIFADFMYLYAKSWRTNVKLILPVSYSI